MFEITLKKIKCTIKDSYGTDSDEPYVVVYSVDLAGIGLSAQGATKTTLYGPWVEDQSMDGGDTRSVDDPANLCWGINEQAQDIEDPQNVLILVGLLESDHDKEASNQLRTNVHALMFAAINTYAVHDMDHAELVEALRQDFQGHLETQRKLVGPPEFDELLGDVQVLEITAKNLADAHNQVVTLPALKFTNDAEDFEYDVTFQMGFGTGSVSQGLGSDPQTVNPALDHHRPAAVCNANGHMLDVVAVPNGSKSAVRVSSANGGNHWLADWKSYQIGQGVFTSGMAAAVSANGKELHVFGRGNDNRIWRAFSPDGGAHWPLAWAPIGEGVFTSAPAAVVSADGKRLHVFGRGNDNRIWRASSIDGGAHWITAWVPIGAGVFTSAPAAAISGDGKQLHVFGRGNDNRIWQAFSPNGGTRWTLAWAPIGEGVFTSAPAAVVSADGQQLHVFGRGNDKRIWRAFSPDGGGHWSLAWAPVGQGVFSSGPAAVASGDGKRIHLFGRGLNPPPPPPGTFPNPEEPRIWRALSTDGGSSWNVAWASIKPAWINEPVPA